MKTYRPSVDRIIFKRNATTVIVMKICPQIMRIAIISALSFTVASCGGSSGNKSSNVAEVFTCLLTLFIFCRDSPENAPGETDYISTPGDGRVPASIIQEQIDTANNGDTVLVAPGTYLGSIDFRGKAIKLVSEQGPLVTIIDGGRVDSPVVTFGSGEGPESILEGFTIQNGHDKGIFVKNSSPTIINNIIANTNICDGAGIELDASSATVRRNTLRDNLATCAGSQAAGAILVRELGSALIVNNYIVDNSSIDLAGGITLLDAGTPIVEGNTITGNSGGAIKIRNSSDALVLQNLIVNNTDEDCGGIDWLVASSSTGPRIINNTIADNDGALGSAICADGFDEQAQLINNIIVSKPGQTAIFCGNSQHADLIPPLFRFNNVFAPSGIAYNGVCTNQTSINGNISADPLFMDKSNEDYQLSFISPAIDAGDNSVDDLPMTDITGNSRIVDGYLNTIALVDLGAYEFTP
jgi:parallel beta-helix repeat protein